MLLLRLSEGCPDVMPIEDLILYINSERIHAIYLEIQKEDEYMKDIESLSKMGNVNKTDEKLIDFDFSSHKKKVLS